ncbi:hypothetical protein FWF48_02750 [Candidatus Saccharibacteria bacterium]|nr:hypothetical protein [Candidatus Saccharibacteria bacterium]
MNHISNPENIGNSSEQEYKYEKTKFPAYYVDSIALDPDSNIQKDPVALVAIDVYVRNQKNGNGNVDVVWFDTMRQCGFKAADLSIDDDGAIKFSAPQNGFSYLLTPMTVELYNTHVRQSMMNGDKEYSPGEEDVLIQDLLDTKVENGSW